MSRRILDNCTIEVQREAVCRKPRKPWTEADTEKMCELQALNWTDGRIAKVLDVARITVWRRRVALGLNRAEHPLKRGRLEARTIRAGYIHAAARRRQPFCN